MALEPGNVLGPYTIEALLGSGGMGEVYRARDARLGRDVALKVIAPRFFGDPVLRRRFATEARAASALNHPAIVTIYDVGEHDGVSWIAMEWVEGRTLRQALSDGSLPLTQAVTVSRQIAEGLAAAHERGIIHRDLKPENIMLRADGGAKILDFGLARQTLVETMGQSESNVETAAAVNATAEGTIVGTVGYMSPEQASGKPVDFRSDQFSFGVIVYEMLAGRRAFARPSMVETLAAIIREDPTPISSLRAGVPESLQKVIARCLAKAPDDRFSSTQQLAAAIESIATRVSVSNAAWDAESTPTEVRGRSASGVRLPAPGRRTLLSIGIAVVLTVAGLAWVRFSSLKSAIDSLAVLPFQNATNDPKAEYLGDGLTESLIDQMSRVPSLKIMARTTVMRFRNASDPTAAGKQLRVGAVLAGTISKRGEQILVSAELVEIPSGVRLWGETYDRPAADLIRIQDSIAWEIVDRLRPQLSSKDKQKLVAHGTKNPEAYELFLRARFLLQHDNEEDDLEARRLYLQAIEKDPAFVDAYVGVASTYARTAGNYGPPLEAWARADEYSRKALHLDPGNFNARVGLAGRHFRVDWDWPLAEREFRQLSGDPRLFRTQAYHPISMYYWATGRPQQSVALLEKALSFDPRNVESRVMLADFLAEAGRLGDSIVQYNAIITDEPADARPLFGLADVLRRRGEVTAAIATLRKAYEAVEEQTGIEALANARTEKDYREAEMAVARGRLRYLEQLAKERYVSPLDLARLHASVGNRQEAVAALELALEERSPGLVYLKVDRAWDTIRDDSRFKAIVHRVGIP